MAEIAGCCRLIPIQSAIFHQNQSSHSHTHTHMHTTEDSKMGSICPHHPREERLSLSPYTELVSPGRWRIFSASLDWSHEETHANRHSLFVWLGFSFLCGAKIKFELCSFCSVTFLKLAAAAHRDQLSFSKTSKPP